MRRKPRTSKKSEGSPSPNSKMKPVEPRPRIRKGAKGKAPTRSAFIGLDEHETSDYIAPSFGPDISRKRGAKIRKSKRWIDGYSFPLTGMKFPYIDELGRFTGQTLFSWSCDPRSFIASCVSTIAKRLERRARYYNDNRVVNRNLQRMVMVSAYYAMTSNNYLWDRVLFFTKNLEKYGTLLHRVLLRYVLNIGESKRFVYSHVCSQTKWLLFRAERPRVKPINDRCRPVSSSRTPGRGVGLAQAAAYCRDAALAMSRNGL